LQHPRLRSGNRELKGETVKRLLMSLAAVVLGLAMAGLAAASSSASVRPATDSAGNAHSSAARFAAAATPFQNKVIEGALARVPGGTRVSAGEAEWNGGHIILGATAPGARANDDPGCEYGAWCAWGATNFNDENCWAEVFTGTSWDWFDWGMYSSDESGCGSVGTWSWYNDSPVRVWKEQNHTGGTYEGSFEYSGGTGSGNNWCISPGDPNGDVTDTQTRTDGWVYLSGTSTPC
jgi:hypothetical protein